MVTILIYFFIAISLSIDSFSMSLSVSSLRPPKKDIISLSLMIGLCHFILSLTGNLFGSYIVNQLSLKANLITSFIFLFLAWNLYKNRNKSNKINTINIFIKILLSITVSIDSMNVGLAFGIKEEAILLPSLIFMIISFFSTILGYVVGKKMNHQFQNKTTYVGIILLIIIAIKYLFSK